MVDMRPTFFSRKNSRVGPPATHILLPDVFPANYENGMGFCLGRMGGPTCLEVCVFFVDSVGLTDSWRICWMRSRHGGVLADVVDIELFKVYVLKSLQWFSFAVDFLRCHQFSHSLVTSNCIISLSILIN